MPYDEMRAQLAEHYGWTFTVIDDMTFDQIESAWTGGKKSKGIPVRSAEEAAEVTRNWRRHIGI